MFSLHLRTSWNSPLFYAALIAIVGFYGLALVQFSLVDACLLVFFTVVGIGTLFEPLVGLWVTLLLGILWAWLRAEVASIPALIAIPVLIFTCAAWLMRGAARRQISLPTPRLLFPVLVFAGAAAFSLWDGVELWRFALPELAKWLQILVLFWLVVDCVDVRFLPWLVGGMMLIGLGQATLGLWQFGLRGSGPEHFAILNGRFYRAYGTFEQPNPYAGYLGLVFPLGAGLTLNWALGGLASGRRGSGVESITSKAVGSGRKNWTVIIAVLLVTGVTGAALIASWSRGGWLGLTAAIFIMVAALPRRVWLGLGLMTLVLVVALGLYAVGRIPASVSARLIDFARDVRFEDVRGVGINDANYAVIERLAHWQAAVEMWRANFWTGVGFGDYEPAYPDYRLLNWPFPLGHAHNYYLNVAAETGLIGLAAYLFLWGAVFWQTWRVTRSTPLRSWRRGFAIGLLGAWSHLSVHHLFDNLFVNNVHLHIGVMLGLLAVLARQETSD